MFELGVVLSMIFYYNLLTIVLILIRRKFILKVEYS